MQTISTGLIGVGASVKDSPNTNAVDLILSTEATPSGVASSALISHIPVVQQPAIPVATTPANTTTVPEPATDYTSAVVLGGLGLGAYLLFSKGGAKAVAGIGKKKNTSSLPLLLVGAAAALWYFTKDDSTATTPAPVTSAPAPVQNPVVPATTTAPPISAPAPVATVIRSAVAQNNLGALQSMFPEYQQVYNVATDAEIITLYQYLVGYVANGLKLYRLPGATGVYPDGNWNTALYDAVTAVKAKYNLNI